jgi:dephospho-CoA kinase
MRVIGITGSIACGKSTVSREMLRRGFPVVDGDALSRELTGPGGEAVPAIRSVFGDRYISRDGSMNRQAMARLVFSDDRSREQLDLVMDPFLRSLTRRKIEQARSAGAKLCFLDMPLLFEKEYDSLCDAVWCVWLPEDQQLERLMARDGYTREEALSRIRVVMSSDRKADLSSAVIDNSGSVEETLRQVSVLLERELQRAGGNPARRRRSVSPPAPRPEPDPDPLAQDPVSRPESSRRKPSSRKAAWPMPRWLSASLIALAAVLALSLTSYLLMRAWLTRQADLHRQEQQAVDQQYPLEYREEILQASRKYNLSPALVSSVIRNESSFRPTVESSVGARGLMQLMPETAEWIAHKLKVDNYSFEQLYDPETNILFGCWYLNYLSTLFHGDPVCVVCAYHAGQGEIKSWLSNPAVSSDGLTMSVDRLPDGPTKTYAGRVTRDYGIYQAKYFSPVLPDAVDSADAAP